MDSSFNRLSLFIFMLKLPQIWPVGTPLSWLLWPFDMSPSFFEYFLFGTKRCSMIPLLIPSLYQCFWELTYIPRNEYKASKYYSLEEQNGRIYNFFCFGLNYLGMRILVINPVRINEWGPPVWNRIKHQVSLRQNVKLSVGIGEWSLNQIKSNILLNHFCPLNNSLLLWRGQSLDS